MKFKQVLCGIAACSMLLSSCATMFNNESQTIIARSVNNEKGIGVDITTSSGQYIAELPTTITAVSSHTNIKIKIQAKCYVSSEVEVPKGITLSFWANIMNGGIGFIVDLATGKLWKYEANFRVPLTKQENCDPEET